MNKIKLLFATALLLSAPAMAQKLVNKAIIKTYTMMEFPENPNAAQGGEGGNMMAMPRDAEINATIYYRDDKTKVETTSDFGKNYLFMDRKEGKTTTLMEVMGRKMGFYSTEQDMANMEKRMDSIRAQRRDSLQALGITFASSEPEIVYTEEKKKIAGYECKKAIIKTKGRNGEINEQAVWYTPDFKLADNYMAATNTQRSGGGGGGMRMGMGGGGNFSPVGAEKLNGFPMEYEIVRGNGMKIHMMVKNVQLDASIDDKTFEIPKGYDIKPMSEMGGPGGGRMQFRVGGAQ